MKKINYFLTSVFVVFVLTGYSQYIPDFLKQTETYIGNDKEILNDIENKTITTSCSNPMGDAQGFTYPPSIIDVVDGCETDVLNPKLDWYDGENTFCYEFTATNSTVNFNVVITSNCGNGNVTNFSWILYNYPSCTFKSNGNINNLTFTGLTVGNKYVFCYKFRVPRICSGFIIGGNCWFGSWIYCKHSQHCPFFVGATTPLPIELVDFTAESKNDGVHINWVTATETNNDYFEVYKSINGKEWESISKIYGVGNSSVINRYNIIDRNPYPGISYYKLKQVDYDGEYEEFDPLSIQIDYEYYPNPFSDYILISNPNKSDVIITDINGKIMIISNDNKINTHKLNAGVYYITINNSINRIIKIK